MEYTGGRLVNSNPSNLQNSIPLSNPNASSPGKPPAHPRPSSFSPVATLQHQNRARRQHVGSQQYEPHQLTSVADRPSLQQTRLNDVTVRGSVGAIAAIGWAISTSQQESDSIRCNHGNVSNRQQTASAANSTASRPHPSTRRNLDAIWPNTNEQASNAAPLQGHLVNRALHVHNGMPTSTARGNTDYSVRPVNQQIAMLASQASNTPRVSDLQQQPPQQHLPADAASMKGSDHPSQTRIATRSNAQPGSLARRPLLAPRNNAALTRVNETVLQPPTTPNYQAIADETVHASHQAETPRVITQNRPVAGLGGQLARLQVPQQSDENGTSNRDVYESTASLTEFAITQSCQQLRASGNESDSETVIYDAVGRDEGSALNDWQQDGLVPCFALGSENLHEMVSLRPHTADITGLAQERQRQPQQVQQIDSQGRAYQQPLQYPHSSTTRYSFGNNSAQPLPLPPWLTYHQEDTVVSTEEIQTPEYDIDIDHNHSSQQEAVPAHFQSTADYFHQHNPRLYPGAAGTLGLARGRQQQQWQQDLQTLQNLARDDIDCEDNDMCDDNSGANENQTDAMNVGIFQAENSRESPVYPGAQLVPGRPQQLARPLVVRVRRRTQDDYQSCSEADDEDSTVSDDDSHNCSDDDDDVDQQDDPDVVSSDMCRYSFDAARQTMTVAEGLMQSHPATGRSGADHVARNSSLRPLLERLGLNIDTYTAQDAPADPHRTQQAGLPEEPEESSSPTLGRFTRVLPPLATHSPVRPYGIQRHSLAESPRTPRSVQQPAGDTSPIHHWMSDHAARLLLPHNMRGMADLFTSDMLWSTRRSAAVLDEISTMQGEAGHGHGRHLAASCPMPLSQHGKVFGSPSRPLAGYPGAKDAFVLDVLSGHLPKPGITELISNRHFMTQLLSSLPGVNPEHSSVQGILLMLSGELPSQMTSLELLPGQVLD